METVFYFLSLVTLVLTLGVGVMLFRKAQSLGGQVSSLEKQVSLLASQVRAYGEEMDAVRKGAENKSPTAPGLPELVSILAMGNKGLIPVAGMLATRVWGYYLKRKDQKKALPKVSSTEVQQP